jgi:hypothetical protein
LKAAITGFAAPLSQVRHRQALATKQRQIPDLGPSNLSHLSNIGRAASQIGEEYASIAASRRVRAHSRQEFRLVTE